MLNTLFLIFGVIGGFAICISTGIDYWWVVALIPGLTIALNAFYLIGLLLVSYCIPPREPKKTSNVCRFVIWMTMDWMMRLLRVKIYLTGTEKFPEEPFVLVSNHRSDFDPMTMLAVMRKKKLAYISKESNFKIPIVGRFVRRAGYLPIDRENGVRALRTLKKASDRMIDEKINMGIYPEGTRSKSGELLKFKSGAFYLAKRANAPIVIMSTDGTEKIPRQAFIKRTIVHLDVLKVLDVETVQKLSTDELAEQCYSAIAAKLLRS